MERVLVVFPTQWDRRHLAAAQRVGAGRAEVVFAEPSDADCPADFDVLAFVERTLAEQRGRIQGVFSSSDYPGAAVAAALATALGLPGSHPSTVLRSSHKYYSRLVQRRAAPEATPDFALVDPKRPDGGPPAIDFPCFIKPVKGSFSVLARPLADPAELAAFLAQPAVGDFMRYTMRIFDALVARYGRFQLDGGWFLAESLLHGQLATVEGFVTAAGRVRILGVVDAVVHPRTKSFLRFDYPSSLPADVQRRMEDVTRRVIAELGLRNTLFNVEMMHDPHTGVTFVVEVNPRICGQFGDLYQKVHGVHSYEIALDLALGREPELQRGAGPFAAASSWPLRVFEPVRVTHVPSPAHIAELEEEFPGTLIWCEVAAGQDLAQLVQLEDGHSVRYAVVNAGGASRAELDAKVEAVREALGFEFEPR
jgi:hypothetical protein